MALPPLRERVASILPLALHFLAQFSRRCGRRFEGFDDAAKDRLLSYGWPGNIRELRNAVERAVVVERGAHITAASLPVGALVAPVGGSLREFLEKLPPEYESARYAFDGHFLRMHFERCGGNQRAMARDLHIARNTLARRLKKLGLT